MGKELREHSFGKSAEEFEKEGFNLSAFFEKSEKSARGNGFCFRGGMVVVLNGDFNAEGPEFAEGRGRLGKSLWGSGEGLDCDANMKDFSMRLARVLSSLQGIVETRG